MSKKIKAEDPLLEDDFSETNLPSAFHGRYQSKYKQEQKVKFQAAQKSWKGPKNKR